MEVYIDKNFVKNYWGVDAPNDSTFLAFRNNFLKYSDRYTLITNFSSFDEINANDEAHLFFIDLLNESKVADIVFLPELMEDENLLSCVTNGGFKIFFLELGTNRIKDLQKKYGYQFVSTELLKEQWEYNLKYESVEKTIALPVDKNDEDIFNSWTDLSFISNFPTNSIVISDKYILSDKTQGRMKYNLVPLLEQLIPKDYNDVLSIVVISEQLLTHDRSSEKDRAVKIHQILNSQFAKFKHCKIRFTIIKYDQYFNSGNQPKIHDRHIYTNYFTVKCGVGFDLFDKDKRKIEDSEVLIRFNFHKKSMKALPAKINGLKAYINNMKTKEKLDAFKMWPENMDNFTCALLN